jgi:spore germination protein GerM
VTRRLLVALLVLLALAAGCGLDEDGSPQAIAPENLPPDLLDPNAGTSTTLAGAPGTEAVSVYLLREEAGEVRLVEVERTVADRLDPGDRLATLFAPPSEQEAARGLVTAIPADTTLRAMPVLLEASDELVLDLSSEFLSVQGTELVKAFAQIVWTVSELDGVERVRFLVDGQEIRAQDADGAEQDVVSESDYRSLAPR